MKANPADPDRAIRNHLDRAASELEAIVALLSRTAASIDDYAHAALDLIVEGKEVMLTHRDKQRRDADARAPVFESHWDADDGAPCPLCDGPIEMGEDIRRVITYKANGNVARYCHHKCLLAEGKEVSVSRDLAAPHPRAVDEEKSR